MCFVYAYEFMEATNARRGQRDFLFLLCLTLLSRDDDQCEWLDVGAVLLRLVHIFSPCVVNLISEIP